MFFGMCNSPATFQAMMDDIFMTMIDNRLVIVYIDNILIFADTKEELERITKQVLVKLREHDLFLKAKKCEFCQTRIEYLGMIIEEGRMLQLFTLLYFYLYFSTFAYVIPLTSGHESSYL
jgi:Reverse transcriptase (RNA-dependent DNA polymerase)